MELEGINKFIKSLEKNIDEETNKILMNTANYIKHDVKSNTPVDTGKLRRMWKVKRVGNKAYIFNYTKYANHVEYGHRKRNGKGIVKGKYMLRNATLRASKKLKEELHEIKIWQK